MPEKNVIGELSEPSVQISRATFERLADLVTRELGIKMPASKVTMLQSRLMRRVHELGLQSINEYCDHLFSSPESGPERAYFINAMTTNKTDFFREPVHFEQLTRKLLPELERRAREEGRPSIKFWSVPCSSGEEPYTLAIVLSEYAALHPGFDFQILGTDVSTKVLQMAKDGVYTKLQIGPVPSELRRKYLLSGRGMQQSLVRVAPALRKRVSLHTLNLMDEDYGVGHMFDVIFCRNVLIYFDRETQEAVINKLCRNLISGGYLFVSLSESLSGLDVPLISLGGSCFKKA